MKTVEEKPLLKVEGLEKSFQKRKVLKGINLNIFSGETIIVMGPSGCGKSTLIRCINRLTEPDDGRIFFAGEEVMGLGPLELSAVRRRIGFVFQQFNLIRRLNVVENVAFALRIDGQPKEEAEAKAMAVLARVGLVERALNFPAELSGGEQQRVAIARALITRPRVLLLDEPLSALDPRSRELFRQELKNIHQQIKTTTIHVTHDFNEALVLADRVGVMNEGEMVQIGIPEEVFQKPDSEFVARFVGIDNIYEGEIVARGEDKWVALDNHLLRVDSNLNGKVRVTIRPEDIIIAREAKAGNVYNAVKGIIVAIIPQGSSYKIVLDAGISIVALVTRQTAGELYLQEGQPVWAVFKAGAVHTF